MKQEFNALQGLEIKVVEEKITLDRPDGSKMEYTQLEVDTTDENYLKLVEFMEGNYTSYRIIGPGEMITMDHLPFRANVRIDSDGDKFKIGKLYFG